MRKIYLLLLLLSLMASNLRAQNLMEFRFKAFNWGAKVGLNATFPIVNSMMIDGTHVEDIRQQYRVGWQATAFARINIDKFFIEPSLSWVQTEADMRFSIPSNTADG